MRESDQEKLDFSVLAEPRKTFELCLSALKNTPAFYTDMMQSLRKEWLLLFTDTKHVTSHGTVPITLICDGKIIIYDILLFSNHMPSILHYFSCVAQVFTKYRLLFKLSNEISLNHVLNLLAMT